jgi:hypothetical protein
VFFGRGPAVPRFKFNGEQIPVRASCKYLGVWLDQAMNGRVLAEAVLQKFTGAVPTFFSLCRRLRFSRLDLVHRLANSLLFSILYGAEFLVKLDVVRQCEQAWWSGVRGFYGLPSGVSRSFVCLLFPEVSLAHRVTRSKIGLLLRGTRTLETIFPEAVVCDRAYLFRVARRGYSQTVKEWCEQLGLPVALYAGADLATVNRCFAEARTQRLGELWTSFSCMSSTRFAAELLGSREALHSVLGEASKFGRLGVRAVVLVMSGSLGLSYHQARSCLHCGVHLSFEHFLSCPYLGPPRVHTVGSSVANRDWQGVALLILSRFEVFVHALRGGQLLPDEAELFSALNVPGESVEE